MAPKIASASCKLKVRLILEETKDAYVLSVFERQPIFNTRYVFKLFLAITAPQSAATSIISGKS